MANNLAYMIYKKNKEWKNDLENANNELFNECLKYKKYQKVKYQIFKF